MGKDLNPRQLRFVTELIKTGVQSRAYLLAGYRPTSRQSLDPIASRLARNAKVKREIARRKAAMLKRSDITIEKLLSDADDARALAMRIDQPSAAASAIQLQAKLVGLLVDRKETGSPGDFAGLTSPAEVVAAIRAEMGEDAARALEAMISKVSAPQVEPIAPPTETIAPTKPTAQGSGTLN